MGVLKCDAELFDALSDPDVTNLVLYDGEFAGHRCTYVVEEDEDGNPVIPVALLINRKLGEHIAETLKHAGAPERPRKKAKKASSDGKMFRSS